MTTILADIGGSKMRFALASEALTPIYSDTPQQYDEGLAQIITTAQTLLGDQRVERLIAGIPGVLTLDKRSLAYAPHLPDWDDKPLAHDLEHALGCSVVLENDTALVGLGEAHYGAGKGSNIMMYLTISTGVNGVRIVDGKIDRSTVGFEIGGQYLPHIDNPATLQTFEEMVSGTAILKKYGVHPRELGIDSPVWEDLARITAIGVHNTILEWSPDTVVLGGSMFNEIGIKVARVEAHLREIMHKFPTIPRLVHSSLHDDGGLYGALVLSKN